MYFLILTNKQTKRMTLLSISGETAIFFTRQDAMAEGLRLYGEDNPHLTYSAIKIEVS